MLYELIGGADLLYVADCKLARRWATWRDRLQGPRTVEQAVADAGATAWLMVAIEGQ